MKNERARGASWKRTAVDSVRLLVLTPYRCVLSVETPLATIGEGKSRSSAATGQGGSSPDADATIRFATRRMRTTIAARKRPLDDPRQKRSDWEKTEKNSVSSFFGDIGEPKNELTLFFSVFLFC
jgi:hypothetical protein